eukprot:6493348-Prymnesium_polylepis.1
MGAMMGALWSTGVEANLNMSVFLHKLFEFDFTSSMSDLVHATANALNGNTVHAMSGNSKTTHTQESNQNILSGGGAQQDVPPPLLTTHLEHRAANLLPSD